jgi:hypothetical protein
MPACAGWCLNDAVVAAPTKDYGSSNVTEGEIPEVVLNPVR